MSITPEEMRALDEWMERTAVAEIALDAGVLDDEPDDVPMSMLVFAPMHPEIDVLPRHTCDNPSATTMCPACIVIEDSQWVHVYDNDRSNA